MFSRLTLLLILGLLSLQESTAQTGKDWLTKISGDTPLQKIHLPGTHNSAALLEPLPGVAKCQELSIEEQLSAGVRFLDLRCRHHDNQFSLYHGPVPQDQTFAEVQQTLIKFLAENPGECLLVSIQETAKPHQNSRSFQKTFTSYQTQAPKLWSTETTLPRLSEARGQAVLIRRFASKKALGIDATHWNSRGIHATPHFLIQDQFKLTIPKDKWTALQTLWKKTPQHPKLLPLNFASGYQPNQLGIPNITAISNEINPLLKKRLSQAPAPSPGVLILDFITPELSQAI